MRLVSLAPILVAVGCVLAARSLGAEARSKRAAWPKVADEPYAPSPEAAPYAALGYRELVTDLLWIRALGYFGGGEATSPGVRRLVVAMAALDPRFERALTWGSVTMESFTMKLTNEDHFAVIAILERGMVTFPESWELPLRAGEIYARGLSAREWRTSWAWGWWWRQVWQRAWKTRGAQLLARAVRMPDAPKSVGTYVAHLESELGQRDKAIRELRELITYTSDARTRHKLVEKLAKLANTPSAGIAYELDVERIRFRDAWQRDRPELPPSMYVVVGPPLRRSFDLRDLAADLAELIEPIEPLPPLPDDAIGEVR